MDEDVFKDVELIPEKFGRDNFALVTLVKTYLESLDIDDAREILERVFPENEKNGEQKVSAPALVELLDDAKANASKLTKTWCPEKSEGLVKFVTDHLKNDVIGELDSKEYVKTISYDFVNVLRNCYKAIENKTHIYRFR